MPLQSHMSRPAPPAAPPAISAVCAVERATEWASVDRDRTAQAQAKTGTESTQVTTADPSINLIKYYDCYKHTVPYIYVHTYTYRLSGTMLWFTTLLALLQLPVLQPSWWSALPVNQTTSRCRGRPHRVLSSTWLWLRMQRASGGPVTLAAPPARYLVYPVDSSTESMLQVSMKSVLAARATLKWFIQVGIYGQV